MSSLGIAINPKIDIYYKFSKPFIDNVEGSDYMVIFYPPAVGGVYPCEQIFIQLKDNPRQIPLDDLAFQWIKGDLRFSKFSIESFESQDFLDQLCITYLIARLRKEYNQSTKTNKPSGSLAQKLEKRKVENDFISRRFLEILCQKVEHFSEFFSNKYNLDYSDVYATAFTFVSVSITGERKKIIEDLLLEYKKNPKDKQKIRAHDRTLRVTPWKTFSKNRLFDSNDGSTKRTDIKTISQACYIKFIETFIKTLKDNHYYGTLIQPLAKVVSDDELLSELITTTINFNSERIFRPNSNFSLLSFIFGCSKRPSKISCFLRDTLLRKNKNDIPFESFETEYSEYDGEYELSPLEKLGEKISEQGSFSENIRYWKKHSQWQDVETSKKQKILDKLSFLTPKKLSAVEKYIRGFEKLTSKERQNLFKARKEIQERKLDMTI